MGIWKDVQHWYSPEKCKLKPQWVITSHLLKWLLSSNSLQIINNGIDVENAAAKLLQSCPTLCYPIDGSPQGSPVPGILQARTLEWVAISFSNAWKWKVKVKSLSHVRLLATPWTAAYQAPPSMGYSRQEYWSGVSLPSPDVENREPLYTIGADVNWCGHFGKQCGGSSKN